MNIERPVRGPQAVMRKFKAFGIPKRVLDTAGDGDIILNLEWLNTRVKAPAKEIYDYDLTFKQPENKVKGELTYHLPLTKWELVQGNKDWLKEIYQQFGWIV